MLGGVLFTTCGILLASPASLGVGTGVAPMATLAFVSNFLRVARWSFLDLPLP